VAFGSNSTGQLGNRNVTDGGGKTRMYPMVLGTQNCKPIAHVACGSDFTAFFEEDNENCSEALTAAQVVVVGRTGVLCVVCLVSCFVCATPS